METFAPARQFVGDPRYREDRERVLRSLDLDAIDLPIRNIIAAFSRLPYCFTLQCCYGHFVHASQRDPHNTERLPAVGVEPVEYRIAYLVLCIEDSIPGRRLRSLLEKVPEIDTMYVQFGSPAWFWERQLNSYALQVEPERLKDKDAVMIGHKEALRMQEVRDLFFERISRLAETSLSELGAA